MAQSQLSQGPLRKYCAVCYNKIDRRRSGKSNICHRHKVWWQGEENGDMGKDRAVVNSVETQGDK